MIPPLFQGTILGLLSHGSGFVPHIFRLFFAAAFSPLLRRKKYVVRCAAANNDLQ
jgi:hypothetical protein